MRRLTAAQLPAALAGPTPAIGRGHLRHRLAAIAFSAVLAVASCGGGEGDSATQDYGTMAVVEGSSDGPDAGLNGMLRIDDDCVMVVVDDGTEVLPLFHDELVQWDDDRRAVLHRSDGATDPAVVSDGDDVALGGAPIDPAEPPLSGPFVGDLMDLLDELGPAWVAEPADSCVARAGSAFGVNSLR